MALQKAPDIPAVAPSLKIWRQRQGLQLSTSYNILLTLVSLQRF